jgi:altronate hydrolase
MSTNTALANRMPDLIDIDAGTIITGEDNLVSKGEALLELIIEVANGETDPKAMQLQQDDFIPWKRGVSL